MTLPLALKWLAQPDSAPSGIADEFARDVVSVHADLTALREKYADLHKQHNALTHEVERLRSQPPTRIWPVHIKCDGKCGAVVAFDPAPEEARMVSALVDLGWHLAPSGEHWCGRCA